LFTEKNKSVAPQVLHASGLNSPDPKCVVSIIGCTADWFGDWDGLNPGSPDKLITSDLLSGRMVDVIESGDPAIMVCHWPGIYFNGEHLGFNILKEVKKRLDQKYNNLIWMKLSEIARYWAARELTTITPGSHKIDLQAPFSTPGFTIKLDSRVTKAQLKTGGKESKPLLQVKDSKDLKSGTWVSDKRGTILCFDLEKGSCEVLF
jgi:hypothetical protein